jgi:hypothetical protein
VFTVAEKLHEQFKVAEDDGRRFPWSRTGPIIGRFGGSAILLERINSPAVTLSFDTDK